MLFLLLAAAGLSTCSQDAQPAPGQTAITVKRAYDEYAKSWYTVYQPADTLYITVAVTAALQQRKLVMNGVELWTDSSGKKNKKTGILYPFNSMSNNGLKQPGDNRVRPMDRAPALDTGSRLSLEKTIVCQQEMRLTGFKKDLNGVQNNLYPAGIQVSLHFTKHTLVYQAQLPLNTLVEPPGVNSHLSVGLVAKDRPIHGMGGAKMPPDGPGHGIMPPP